jgi:colicin import membrane protein
VQAEAKKPPPPPKPDAEPIENAGKPTTKAEVQAPPPLPPVKPRLPEKKEAAKPKTEPKPLHDQVAQLLEEKRLEEIAAAAEKPVKPTSKPPAKPKSGDETAKPTRRPDFDAIRQLVSHEDPQSTGSTGRQLKRVASLGSANSDDEKTTPSKLNELDDMLIEQYKSCWTLQGYSEGKHYVALISAEYYRDGTLKGEPVLQNTPSDPALRVLAESALDAVRKCNPLRIPPEFQSSSYYNYWRGPRSVKFDPAEMLN